ncbi:MAG: carbohydrate binding domain-containing protein, partial [Clostridia bacterium]|nr:carbohydrate binding domain-containing protein [Clostridia bacterium]
MSWVEAEETGLLTAPGRDKYGFDENTLLSKVLKEDGFLNGIDYMWIEDGHTFSDNYVFGYDTNTFSDGNGAEQAYNDMINIKALGYNAVHIMAQGGMMEGVVYGDHGEVLGLSEDYKQNFRKFLQIIDETETNIAVFLQFHTTQIYEKLGKDAWDYATQFYASEEVCQQYMDRVMTPILDMLKEVEHRILFLSLGDELENEINDSELGWNTNNSRVVYGVSFDDMYRFYSELNDLCKAKMPDIPRTIGANAYFLHKYGELELTAIGHNRYTEFGTDFELMDHWEYKTGLPMYFPEWGIDCWTNQMSWQAFEDRNMVMLDKIRENGFFGAFFWRYEHTQKSDAQLTMYNTFWEFPADYNTLATRFAYEARKDLHAYQGTDGSFDPPVMFAYNGDGLVTWLHAEKGETFDLERSLDGGKTWTKLLTGVKNSACVSPRNANIGYYQDDEVQEDQEVLYRVTAYGAGKTQRSEPSVQVPATAASEGGGSTQPEVDDPTEEPADNLVKNGDFEDGLDGWTTWTADGGVCVIDPTADAEGGPAVKITGRTDYTAELSTVIMPVTPGVDYEVSFDMLSDPGYLSMGLFIKGGTATNCGKTIHEEWPKSAPDGWERKTYRFNSEEYEYIRICFSNASLGQTYHVDNVTLRQLNDKPVRYLVTDYTPANLTVRDEANNRITDGGFEAGGGNWNVETFVDGATLRVVTDAEGARYGDAFLRYEGKGLTETHQAVFYVDVQPNTSYNFAAWIKGHNLSADNNGDVFIGVVDPVTGCYLVGDALEAVAGAQLDFSGTRGIKPTGFDGDWHLRGLTFQTKELTRVGIMISGTNARMDIDNLVLCKESDAAPYVSPLANADMATKIYFDERGCDVEDNLLLNYNFESDDLSYWTAAHGYGNFVTVGADPAQVYGNSLHYVGDEPWGLYFTRWVALEPYTDYVFSYDIKVTETGDGYIGLMDDKIRYPDVFHSMDFDKGFLEDMDDDGDGWITFCCAFNSDIFSRVALIIYDGGGEAYFDNLRLFKESDAKEVVNDNKPFDAPEEPAKNGWVKEEGKWAYYENGVKVTNKWVKDSAGWCYLGADGYAVTNTWKKDSHGWCYLNGSGSMIKNAWVKDNGKWYFLDQNGYMVTNAWKKDSKGWVYVGKDGAMLTNAW